MEFAYNLYLHLGLQPGLPTHHFIPVDSVWCWLGGKFEFWLLETSRIFFVVVNISNLQLVDSTDADREGQLYGPVSKTGFLSMKEAKHI